MRYYAGIGSRETPKEFLRKFEDIAKVLAEKGFTLRSGGADGADTAFEFGCDEVDGNKEIYLPWKGFNKNPSPLFDPPKEAFDMAAKFHPAWFNMKQGAQRMHARNCQQVLGKELDTPVDFVLCYTRLDKGGTLQALRVAGYHKIPIFNFYMDDYSIENILEEIG
jgi:hypothetical protein